MKFFLGSKAFIGFAVALATTSPVHGENRPRRGYVTVCDLQVDKLRVRRDRGMPHPGDPVPGLEDLLEFDRNCELTPIEDFGVSIDAQFDALYSGKWMHTRFTVEDHEDATVTGSGEYIYNEIVYKFDHIDDYCTTTNSATVWGPVTTLNGTPSATTMLLTIVRNGGTFSTRAVTGYTQTDINTQCGSTPAAPATGGTGRLVIIM
jgi:hypothetical protein